MRCSGAGIRILFNERFINRTDPHRLGESYHAALHDGTACDYVCNYIMDRDSNYVYLNPEEFMSP